MRNQQGKFFESNKNLYRIPTGEFDSGLLTDSPRVDALNKYHFVSVLIRYSPRVGTLNEYHFVSVLIRFSPRVDALNEYHFISVLIRYSPRVDTLNQGFLRLTLDVKSEVEGVQEVQDL